MIKEAYVSFEVAKLLKEKRFNEPCYSYYMTTKTLHTTFHNRVHVEEEPHFNSGDLNGMYDVDESSIEDICSAPTHQMAMAWLRKIHGIFIAINNDDLDFNWQCYDLINRDDALDPRILSESYAGYKTYEEAVEAALKFSLKNLI